MQTGNTWARVAAAGPLGEGGDEGVVGRAVAVELISTYRHFEALCQPAKCFGRLQHELRRMQPPCVPYLPPFVRSLAAVASQLPGE